MILGEPALSLVGLDGPGGWGPKLNHQGVQVTLLVFEAASGKWRTQSVARPLRRGEVFKFAITPSFDAVIAVDRVSGRGWSLTRTGPVEPAQVAARVAQGHTLLLPAGARAFRIGAEAGLVLSIGHAKATSAATSSRQPAYRRDLASASNYLQLVPSGTYPLIEQLFVLEK